MGKDVIIELNNVSKITNGKWIIKRINLQIFKGDSIAVIGRHGSGKETLINLISSMDKVSAGSIEYFVDENKVLRAFGIQMPNKGWPLGFKTKDIINLHKNIYGIYDEVWVSELIDIFDIKEIYNKELYKCDPIWQQLFSIFLLFIHKPSVVFLEDISSSISLDIRIKVMSFLKKYKEKNNATYIVLSPDSYVFNELCNKVVALERGSIVYNEYEENWPENTTFDSLTQYLINAINDNEMNKIPDSVLRIFITEFDTESQKFIEKIEVYINSFDQPIKNKGKKVHDFVVLLYNAKMFIDYAKSNLDDLSISSMSSDNFILAKHNVALLKHKIHELVTLTKKIRKRFSTEPLFIELNNSLLKYNVYLNKKLFLVFKDQHLIMDDQPIAKLSRSEQKKLRSLKRKYIKEEFKIMRQNALALKKEMAGGN